MGYWETTIENDGTLYWYDYEWIPDDDDEEELRIRDPRLDAKYYRHDRLDDYDLDEWYSGEWEPLYIPRDIDDEA